MLARASASEEGCSFNHPFTANYLLITCFASQAYIVTGVKDTVIRWTCSLSSQSLWSTGENILDQQLQKNDKDNHRRYVGCLGKQNMEL